MQGIGFTLGRMYSLTFLLNLLIRGRIGKDGKWLSSGSLNASGSNTIVMPRSLGHIESGPMNDGSGSANGNSGNTVKVGFRGVKIDKYVEVYDEQVSRPRYLVRVIGRR
jgi:hypothetical protein